MELNMCSINSGAIVLFHWSVLELLESQGIFGILEILEPRLVTSFMDVSTPCFFSEKSRAPLFANASSNFGHIVSQ